METASYAVIWLGLGLYALLAGADFGVGIWLIAARFTKRGEQIRRDALGYFGPVWEVNTLFLVFFIVGLMAAFPGAIGLLGDVLIPLVLAALVMFVVRSGAYALVHFGPERSRGPATWAFAVSSIVAGVGLGYAAAAPASGHITDDTLAVSFYTSAVALAAIPLTLAASAHLSALVVAAYGAVRGSEATPWFRRAAIVSGGAVLPFVALFTLAIVNDVPHTSERLKDGWAIPMVAGALIIALGSLQLLRRRYASAALLTFAGYLAGLLGGAFAQLPYVVYPALTLEEAAAPDASLVGYLGVTAVGGPLLIAAMVALYHMTLGPNRQRSAPPPARGDMTHV